MWDESKVRIKDIADELGVSTATVSNVLHGKTKKISDATVKRVEKKLEERGYIPNMAATLLARNDSRIIGVAVNDHEKYEGRVFEDPFIASALNYLSDEIEDKGYFMMLKKAHKVMDIVRFASMWNLDGMIMIGFCEDEYQELRDRIRVPFVVYDGYSDKQSRYSIVTIDDYDGGRQVGEYLKSMGHEKVLCIADNHICMDLDRYNGLCCGLGSKADFLMIPASKEERLLAFYDEKMEYLKEHTAVFAASDLYAIELAEYLIRHGIRVPEDISVVGFDGINAGMRMLPALTTVYQDNRLRAETSMDILTEMINDRSFSKNVCLPVKLRKGGTVSKTGSKSFPITNQ